MIKTCEECPNSCCKTGPGPYKNVSPEDYLENFATVEAYNTKCIAFTSEGKCNLWNTPDLPQECRTYICQTRSYTKKELEIIDDIFERECPNCGCSWLIGSWQNKIYFDTCEICGYQVAWEKTQIFKTNNLKLF